MPRSICPAILPTVEYQRIWEALAARDCSFLGMGLRGLAREPARTAVLGGSMHGRWHHP